MTSFERIGSTPPVNATALAGAGAGAGDIARTTMATVGERVIAWTAQSFGTGGDAAARWQAQTGGSGGFVPDHAELGRRGDVYELRSLTAEIGRQFGASPSAEGALGRAVDDFARAVALRFNALAGGDNAAMLDDVAKALTDASAAGPDGIAGITSRIETAARAVETLNQ